MTWMLAVVAGLWVASAVVVLGWRSPVGADEMARALGLSEKRKSFSLEEWVAQLDAGLTAPQVFLGWSTWVLGGGVLGFLEGGPLGGILFSLASGVFYWGLLQQRREHLRTLRAKHLARALSVIQTLLEQGRGLMDALEEAARAVPPEGQQVLMDLVIRLRSVPADAAPQGVREWSARWNNPAVDMIAAALLTALEGRMEIGRFVETLRGALQDVLEVLETAHAEAQGILWQTRFLTFWPPLVFVVMVLLTPERGWLYRTRPWLLLPMLLGSFLTYVFSLWDLRRHLSLEAAVGLSARREGEIRLDRMGRVL